MATSVRRSVLSKWKPRVLDVDALFVCAVAEPKN